MKGSITALGIDIGGTKIAGGLVQFPAGEVGNYKTIPTRAERSGEAVLQDTVQLAEALIGNSKIEAIGLALCELVSPSGEILSDNCVAWKATQVRSAFKNFAPLVLEADVRAAARAEALFGAGRDYQIFLYITIGTGISCCLMVDGSPYLGARGATGTMASSPISISCERCGAMNQRTLEQIASGPALVTRYHRKSVSTAKDVVIAANSGEADALGIVRTAADALGATIGGLINVLDPEAVIVGGGLGLSEGVYWDSLKEATRRHIWSHVNQSIPIQRAATGSNAGVLGAALAAWQREK